LGGEGGLKWREVDRDEMGVKRTCSSPGSSPWASGLILASPGCVCFSSKGTHRLGCRLVDVAVQGPDQDHFFGPQRVKMLHLQTQVDTQLVPLS
jgi:hypothetical protein